MKWKTSRDYSVRERCNIIYIKKTKVERDWLGHCSSSFKWRIMVNCIRGKMAKRSYIFIDKTIAYFEVYRSCQWINLGPWNKREVKVWSTEGMESPFREIKRTARGKFCRRIMRILFETCKISTCRRRQYMGPGEMEGFVPVKILHYAAVNRWLPNLSGLQ